MKKFLNKDIYFILMLCSVAIGILFASCNDENMGVPVITDVRNYTASPNDTIMTDAVAKEQWVVIEGQNLQNALKISFNGVSAAFKSTFLTPNSAVVQIPAITFSTIDEDKLYTIEYVTSEGSTTFSFKLGPAAPVITAISDVFAQPADSVYIYGKDLVLVQEFSYGGTPISSFKSNLDGSALGFVMPNPAPTSGDVVITTVSGVATFKIVATPTITGISNENAVANDSVYVYGTYLKGIQSFSFGGTTISSYKSYGNGTSVGFVLPSSVQTGPVSIATTFGTASTVYNVNDIAGIGSISNWEWSGNFNWKWWGGATLVSGNPSSGWPPYDSRFPGNNGMYVYLKNGVLAPSEGNTYSNYAILMNEAQWVPTANINDPIENYALKFEVNIPELWNGGAIDIMSTDQTYIFRWEPWQISETTTKAFSTKGWKTVTVPFSEFRAKDDKLGEGRGESMKKFANLLGTSGKSECTIYMHNYSTSATATGFLGSFDNIRVVKIK